MKILVSAKVGRIGGALTENWDTLRLWKSRGVDIGVLIPADRPQVGREQLTAIGCRCLDYEVGALSAVPGLAESSVIGLCNFAFLKLAPELKRMGCRLGWYNCMTWAAPEEVSYYRQSGLFDVHIYNCGTHLHEFSDVFEPLGLPVERSAIVQPAFELSEWPFLPRPAEANEDFVVGRLARPDFSKWSKRTWEIFGRVAHPRRRALLMGVDEDVRKWLGPAPEWAEILPPGALPAAEFYRRTHCLLPFSHAAIESWPRIGLEAMACGVPIVAPRQGGWCDLIVHGETGYLAQNADEFVIYANLLAQDEALRLRIAAQARKRLETELACPQRSWQGWLRVFEQLRA